VTTVLVVDDAPQIVRTLALNLRARGYGTATATTGRQALAEVGRNMPDAIFLDLGLPDMDGRSVITSLRAWTDVPIIVLSGRSEETQKIAALDAGADDYVTKPFDIEELFARLRAVSRRQVTDRRSVIPVGGWLIDLTRHRVQPATGVGPDQHLTRTEWTILEVLAASPGRLVTRAQLLRAVWGSDFDPETSSLRLYVAQLRHKLESSPDRPSAILTEPGIGYRLVLTED